MLMRWICELAMRSRKYDSMLRVSSMGQKASALEASMKPSTSSSAK